MIFFLEIDDGEDENVDHGDAFGRLKGKIPDHEMSGDGQGDNNDKDEDDDSNFDIDETDLESYSTVLEANEDIDEFQIFCDSLQRKYQSKDHHHHHSILFLKNFNRIQLVIIKLYYKV